MKTYPVHCPDCQARLVGDEQDLVCPAGHPAARLAGALTPTPPVRLDGFMCLWDGHHNLAKDPP